MVFYDIDKAEEDGHFGPEPMIWKSEEMHFALEMLASGLDIEGQAWEDHVYHPTKWSDDGVERTQANESQMQGLMMLRYMKKNHRPWQPTSRASQPLPVMP